MKQNFIQIIEECLAKYENTKIVIGQAPIGVLSAMNLTVFPQEVALNDLLEHYPDSIEIKYAVAIYHKKVRSTDFFLDRFNKDNYFPENEKKIKLRIDKLISTYCKS